MASGRPLVCPAWTQGTGLVVSEGVVLKVPP